MLRNISWHYPQSGDEEALVRSSSFWRNLFLLIRASWRSFLFFRSVPTQAKAIASRMELLAVSADRIGACKRHKTNQLREFTKRKHTSSTANMEQSSSGAPQVASGSVGGQHTSLTRLKNNAGSRNNNVDTHSHGRGGRGGRGSNGHKKREGGRSIKKHEAKAVAGISPQNRPNRRRNAEEEENIVQATGHTHKRHNKNAGRQHHYYDGHQNMRARSNAKQTHRRPHSKRRQLAYETLLDPPDRHEFDAEWIHMLTSWLNPSNMNIILESPTFPTINAEDSTSPIFEGVECARFWKQFLLTSPGMWYKKFFERFCVCVCRMQNDWGRRPS